LLFPLDIGYSVLDIGYSPPAVHSYSDFLSFGLRAKARLKTLELALPHFGHLASSFWTPSSLPAFGGRPLPSRPIRPILSSDTQTTDSNGLYGQLRTALK